MATSIGLIPFRGVADEILAVHGQIHRLAQPDNIAGLSCSLKHKKTFDTTDSPL